MAAFCTQCGAAIPSGAQVRPRGMDRQELDARIRQRRPGDARLRRGTPVEPTDARPGYVPFEPDPQDARARREAAETPARVDNTAPDFDERGPQEPEPAYAPAPGYDAPAYEPPAYEAPAYEEPYEAPPPYAAAVESPSDAGYGAPEDAYPYWEAEEPGRGGPGMLPILGFIGLAVLALGVGAALAGMFGGGAANATATPSPSLSASASIEPSGEATPSEGDASPTPEPTDGPVAFPDGAEITVQPCATDEMSFDGCIRDGSTITRQTMWVWIGFRDAAGSDTFTLELRSGDQTLDEQEKELGSVLDCPGTCTGYLIGAVYRDLDPGEYQLVVRRNDDFADSAAFTVK
jgi:hypothetical protein